MLSCFEPCLFFYRKFVYLLGFHADKPKTQISGDFFKGLNPELKEIESEVINVI